MVRSSKRKTKVTVEEGTSNPIDKMWEFVLADDPSLYSEGNDDESSTGSSFGSIESDMKAPPTISWRGGSTVLPKMSSIGSSYDDDDDTDLGTSSRTAGTSTTYSTANGTRKPTYRKQRDDNNTSGSGFFDLFGLTEEVNDSRDDEYDAQNSRGKRISSSSSKNHRRSSSSYRDESFGSYNKSSSKKDHKGSSKQKRIWFGNNNKGNSNCRNDTHDSSNRRRSKFPTSSRKVQGEPSDDAKRENVALRDAFLDLFGGGSVDDDEGDGSIDDLTEGGYSLESSSVLSDDSTCHSNSEERKRSSKHNLNKSSSPSRRHLSKEEQEQSDFNAFSGLDAPPEPNIEYHTRSRNNRDNSKKEDKYALTPERNSRRSKSGKYSSSLSSKEKKSPVSVTDNKIRLQPSRNDTKSHLKRDDNMTPKASNTGKNVLSDANISEKDVYSVDSIPPQMPKKSGQYKGDEEHYEQMYREMNKDQQQYTDSRDDDNDQIHSSNGNNKKRLQFEKLFCMRYKAQHMNKMDQSDIKVTTDKSNSETINKELADIADSHEHGNLEIYCKSDDIEDSSIGNDQQNDETTTSTRTDIDSRTTANGKIVNRKKQRQLKAQQMFGKLMCVAGSGRSKREADTNDLLNDHNYDEADNINTNEMPPAIELNDGGYDGSLNPNTFEGRETSKSSNMVPLDAAANNDDIFDELNEPQTLLVYDGNEMNHMDLAYTTFSQSAVDVLRIRKHDMPPFIHSHMTDIVVKVEASTVSASDCVIRKGEWWWEGDVPLPNVPGVDFIGTIYRIAPELASAKNLRVGDRVMSLCKWGGNARYITTQADNVVKVSKGVKDSAEAVCLIETYLSAFQALHVGQRGDFRYKRQALLGKSILYVGSMSALSKAILELAIAGGSKTVYATAQIKLYEEYLDSLGVVPLLDSDIESWLDTLSNEIDLILIGDSTDNIDPALFFGLMGTLNDNGLMIFVGKRVHDEQHQSNVLWKTVSNMWSWPMTIQRREDLMSRTHTYDVFESWARNIKLCRKDLSHLVTLLGRKVIKPIILDRISLEKVPYSQEILEEKNFPGVIVCEPWIKTKNRAAIV